MDSLNGTQFKILQSLEGFFLEISWDLILNLCLKKVYKLILRVLIYYWVCSVMMNNFNMNENFSTSIFHRKNKSSNLYPSYLKGY